MWRDQPHAPAASTPGKDPVPILQGAGWAPGPVWRGRKTRPHRDSIPDRPARSQSLYPLSYPFFRIFFIIIWFVYNSVQMSPNIYWFFIFGKSINWKPDSACRGYWISVRTIYAYCHTSVTFSVMISAHYAVLYLWVLWILLQGRPCYLYGRMCYCIYARTEIFFFFYILEVKNTFAKSVFYITE